MSNEAQARLLALQSALQSQLTALLKPYNQMWLLRQRTREIAQRFPEFIIWSPTLVDSHAVIDIQSRIGELCVSVKVAVPREWHDAPVW